MPISDNQNLLEVQNLSAGYGGRRVLHDVSISIGKGELVGLLGANNAGKSTLINCLSGIVAADTGRVAFDGNECTDLAPHLRVERGIVHVPEGRLLFPGLTVRENLQLAGINPTVRRDREARIERVIRLFPRVGERLDQLAGTLSGGEQQMVAISRGLVSGARLLMLDEPSLGLSPLMVRTIFAAIKRLNEEEKLTILLVEQNLRLTIAHASRCYVLEHGRVVLSGSSAELAEDPRTRKAYLGM